MVTFPKMTFNLQINTTFLTVLNHLGQEFHEGHQEAGQGVRDVAEEARQGEVGRPVEPVQNRRESCQVEKVRQ